MRLLLILSEITGGALAVLAAVLLGTYFNSATSGYTTTIRTNTYGEFWPEVAGLVGMLVLGAVLYVWCARMFYQLDEWRLAHPTGDP